MAQNLFSLLFCQLEIQILIRLIFQIVKIQIIAEHTQPRRVGTAANYKVLHNHMSAQLLLNKHRHSKKPTGAKSQELHHKGIYNQKTLIGY